MFEASKRHSCPDGSGGFTLLEVLVAVAIVSVVLVTIIGSISYHLSVVEDSRKMTIASMIAREKLEEVMISGPPTPPAGVESTAYDDFAWQYVRSKTQFPGVARSSVVVSWGRGRTLSVGLYERAESMPGGA